MHIIMSQSERNVLTTVASFLLDHLNGKVWKYKITSFIAVILYLNLVSMHGFNKCKTTMISKYIYIWIRHCFPFPETCIINSCQNQLIIYYGQKFTSILSTRFISVFSKLKFVNKTRNIHAYRELKNTIYVLCDMV